MRPCRFAWRSRRSAAVAGIVFGVLLLVALTMLRIALSRRTRCNRSRCGCAATGPDPTEPPPGAVCRNCLSVVWVIRDQLGKCRGSARSLLSSWAVSSQHAVRSAAFRAGCWRCSPVRASMLTRVRPQRHQTLISVYAMRMAAVFTISVSTANLQCRRCRAGSPTLAISSR